MTEDQKRFVRRCHRVLRMVSELHKQQFQGLRVRAFEGGSAGYLRIIIECGPNQTIDPAVYAASQGVEYFGWRDAASDNARELAIKFRQRFPLLCELSKGRDWAYAGWLQELIGFLECGPRLPSMLWEYMENDMPNWDNQFLPIKKFSEDGCFVFECGFPLPPVSTLVPSL